MKPKLSEDIRRRLTLREVPKPPEDLANQIKKDIPARFKYKSKETEPRGTGTGNFVGNYWGLSWQLAASVLVVIGLSYGLFRVSSREKAVPTAVVAESESSRQPAPAVEAPRSDDTPTREQPSRMSAPPPLPADMRKMEPAAPKLTPAAPATSATSSVAIADASAYVPVTPPPRPLPDQPPASVREKKDTPAEEAIAEGTSVDQLAAVSNVGTFAPETTASGRDLSKAAGAPSAASAMRAQADDKDQDAPSKQLAAAIPLEPIKPVKVSGGKGETRATVVVEAAIDSSGRVTAAKVIRSVSADADRLALDAVRTARFRPPTKDGKPAAAVQRVEVPVDFVK